MSEDEKLIQRRARGQKMVDEFLWRFEGDGDYRALACHAALPLILTPTLLKFLRHEFLPHLSWVAEVDLLLSNLCGEASEDVYVMKREPRAYLIEQMREDPQMGEARIEAVNRLLIGGLSYLMREHPGILQQEWRAQNWSAMLYVADRRDEAARALAEAVYRCIVRGDAGPGYAGANEAQAELVRLTRLVRDAAENLRDYPELVQFAELTARIMADQSGQFTEQLRGSGQLAKKFRLPGLAAELHLEEVTLLRSRKGDRGRRVPIVSPLHQLPPRLPDFTGREHELVRLSHALDSEGAIILGPRGVGKTTLALEVARRASSRYPDAQFYIDLGGETQHPLTAADVLSRVIHAWQPEIKLPDDETELRELYQSILRGRRVLLVLDNAVDSAQVESLNPPSDCSLIVTSRRDVDVKKLPRVVLGSMPPEVARAFLLTLAPRIGELADKIIKLCGGQPLALRIAGSTLAAHVDLSVEEYLKELTEVQNTLKSSGQEFSAPTAVSYSKLTPEQQQQWAELVVFPQTFGVKNAAIIWKTSDEEASVALSDMTAAGLLEFSNADGHYWMHELLAEFARSQLDPDRLTTAKSHHAAYMLGVLSKANDEYLRGGDSVLRALNKFDLEWDNIKSAQAWASGAADNNELAALLCIDFPLVGEYLLDLRCPPRERLLWLEQAYAQALEANSPRLGHLLGNLGHLYATLGDLHRAIEFYEQALELTRTQGNRAAEGYLLNNLGSNYMRLGELERAREFFMQSLDVSREIGDRRTESQILSNLGNAFRSRRDFEQAHNLYEQGLSIARQLGDIRGESQAIGNLGIAYAEMGQHERAIELFRRQLDITRQLGDLKGEAFALDNLANVFDMVGRREEALASAEAALRLFEELELPEIESARELLARLRATAPTVKEKPLKVIVSHAHQDEKLKDELVTYLEAADLGAPIEFSGPYQVRVGESVETVINELIDSSDIILLLLSPHFVASSQDSDSLLETVAASVPSRPTVPVLLSPFESQSSWVKVAQCLPQGAKPVTEWSRRVDAYRNIAEGLKVIVTRLNEGWPVAPQRDTTEEMLRALAYEYEDLRERMSSGTERTRLMEGVASRMQELAASAVPLLPPLTGSNSPGIRLAAVVTLEERPDPQYLSWLADRLGVEKPFVGYHASLALLSAVKNLDTTFYGRIGEALNSAIKNLGAGHEKTDRLRTLNKAKKLLREYWTSRYFNPPAKIREIGRPLTSGDYYELTGQLENKECLVGLFYNQVDALVATHIQSRARKDDIERLANYMVEYYAVDIDAAKQLADTPFPTESKQDG
jgi:tetratricopeptide (TPR) repeat protein